MLRTKSRFILMSLSSPLPLLSLRYSTRSWVSLACFSTPRPPRVAACSRTRLGLGLPVRASEQIHTHPNANEAYAEPSGGNYASHRAFHPWPEWSKLVENARAGGYFDREVAVVPPDDDDGFSLFKELPVEFLQAANACLSFARSRPDLLSSLPKKDIEVLVENGSAFLFKNGMNSTKRLMSFLGKSSGHEFVGGLATTVDVMRYLLSYTYNALIASDSTRLNNVEFVEASTRNLLNELSSVSESMPREFTSRRGQFTRPFGQNIEMKRGDWICPKCSFMNFARNVKCLECNEARPMRLLTGGEWECPQCNFFNYGRNVVCLRCDCKSPEGNSLPASSSSSASFHGQTLNFTRTKSDIESTMAPNDEKAGKWSGEVSHMDDGSNNAVAGEDFQEIMPLRKGINRFVVSTRKTPLERRLENVQDRRNLGNPVLPEASNDFQGGNMDSVTSNSTSKSSISETLDRIFGRSTEMGGNTPGKTNNLPPSETEQRSSAAQYRQNVRNQKGDSSYVPFVPLPKDMFAKPSNTSTGQASDISGSLAKDREFSPDPVSGVPRTGESTNDLLNPKQGSPIESNEGEESQKSDRWFEKAAVLHDVTDRENAISDDDFPEIMPMRKGENRFVVSKKKDRSLTSPQNKRRLSMEQTNTSNFVPFVPFPPGYFAKKDKDAETPAANEMATPEVSAPGKHSIEPNNSMNSRKESLENKVPFPDNQQTERDLHTSSIASDGFSKSQVDSAYKGPMDNSARQSRNSEADSGKGWISGLPVKEANDSSAQRNYSAQTSQFTGKSLEGSLVKEIDPLDMSEEAKAERWFRRVAQIKDISELSQIPDEDFPSIMPMRKGVNRFVVSKRKTPLERRLTSPQYRRNLPVVGSDAAEEDSSK